MSAIPPRLTVVTPGDSATGHSQVMTAPCSAALVVGRQLGRRGAQVGSNAARELAQLRAAVDDLQDAAGRPLSAIIASYRRVQQRYEGP